MLLSYAAASTTSVTPPVADLSRYRLKQFAHWIRDHLDILVAREGPDILRPDDVLTLHELFVALRHSTSITALDLRATGIHKAVKDIAGIATRWPRRLCDDCDKIMTTWQSRFGRFEDLPPFLYGRGGRLEGIASVSEYSNEALLKKWSKSCPEKISHGVSHKQGSLGFKAGDWWINPLFAHHAGIIGLESIEGGTTYDKNGAYALLLKDTDEIDPRSEGTFTYRCPIKDKGKFRLTAATPVSRDPIRVLRSHSIKSIWAPKAGVRYEGLYSVRGWCIRQARLKDTQGGEWKEGDILYEVTLQRKDPVPMEQVSCRPTNMEVDDYAEYKRLRKMYRELKHIGVRPTLQQVLKAAPPIPPLQLPASPTIAARPLLRVSPSVSATFTEPAFDAPRGTADRLLRTEVVSPMTVPGLQETFFVPEKPAAVAIPAPNEKLSPYASILPDVPSHERYVRVQSPSSSAPASSVQSSHNELKEIIPWIDLETPPAIRAPPVVREQKRTQADERFEVKAAEMNPVKNVRRLARDLGHSNMQSQTVRDRDIASNALNFRLHSTKPVLPMLRKKKGKEAVKEKEKKKLHFGKSARFFDGAGYSADDDDEEHYQVVSPRSRRLRCSSADDLPIIQSPRPLRPLRPNSLFDYGIEHIEFASPLETIVPHPRAASPMNSLTIVGPGRSHATGESVALGKLRRWLSK